jgi:hypothetical protein
LVALMCLSPQRMHRRTVYTGSGAGLSTAVTTRGRLSLEAGGRSSVAARAGDWTRRRRGAGLMCATVNCKEAYSTWQAERGNAGKTAYFSPAGAGYVSAAVRYPGR